MMWKDCPHCDQSFALQSTLNKHLASDHGKLNERNAMVATLNEKDHRIAELESLLREIDRKVIFETSVMDGTGTDLQERIEAALRSGVQT